MKKNLEIDFTTKRTPLKTVRFDVFDILDLMAKEYVIETSDKIMKATLASSKGVLLKAGISEKQIGNFCIKIEDSISDILEDTFADELSEKFTENDFIILNLYEDFIELQISDVFAKTTDELRILFNVLFVRNIDAVVMLDNYRVYCNNCTLVSEIVKGLCTPTDMVKLVLKGFPFYFTEEDFKKKDFMSSKFKKLKSLRSK